MSTILLADQSEDYVQVVRRAVRNRFDGLGIDVAHTVDSAKDWLDATQSGLVFMHFRIDGHLTLDLVGTTKRVKPAITIVTVTDYELPEYRHAALAHGADCVIAKQTPLAIEEIMARIGAFKGSSEGLAARS